MSRISAITAAAKKFAGKPLEITSKAIGVASIASVLYDAHINGREKAYSLDENETADRFINQYDKYMKMEGSSATVAKMKKSVFEFERSFPYYHIVSKVKGYASGFGKTIAENLPIIGLSAAALKFKNAGKVAGCLLALNGAKTVLYDVIGIGADKRNRHF